MTKSASKVTGDLFKTTKLNLSLSTEQAALNKLYAEIGKKVHEIYQYGGTLGELFDKYYANIQAHEAKMEDIKAQIAVIRGVRECPHCNKPVDRTSDFCSKCGTSLVPIITAHDAPTTTPPHEAASYDAPPIPQVHASQSPPSPQPASTATPSPAFKTAAPIPTPPPTPSTSPLSAPTATRTCRVCGTANEPTAKFCLSCGRIVD